MNAAKFPRTGDPASLRAQAFGAGSNNVTLPLRAKHPGATGSPELSEQASRGSSRTGWLIVNADDWGRDRDTTDRTLECIVRGSVSSVSGMVFMEDSERAAAIAREHEIDAGLHLNLTLPFSSGSCSTALLERQHDLAPFLRHHRLAAVLFNPWLAHSFEYVVKAQVEEYCRLYGTEPKRVDGHHHMHLCANVLLAKLFPSGIVIRRNFTFQSREKSFVNRIFRKTVDRHLAKRYCMVDLLFSLKPLEPAERLQRIFSLANRFVVELETHPATPEEYRFLAEGEIFRRAGDLTIAPNYAVAQSDWALATARV